MKITRKQLRKIISEAVQLAEYGESGSWGSPMNDYEQGYSDGHGGHNHQGSTGEYDEGYEAGKLAGMFADERTQDDYDDQIMDVGYYYD